MKSTFSIRAYPIDHPDFGRFWRSEVVCPHGLVWWAPWLNSPYKTEQDALRAADAYRDEMRQLCSDETCKAVVDGADAPSAIAHVTVNPQTGATF